MSIVLRNGTELEQLGLWSTTLGKPLVSSIANQLCWPSLSDQLSPLKVSLSLHSPVDMHPSSNKQSPLLGTYQSTTFAGSVFNAQDTSRVMTYELRNFYPEIYLQKFLESEKKFLSLHCTCTDFKCLTLITLRHVISFICCKTTKPVKMATVLLPLLQQ